MCGLAGRGHTVRLGANARSTRTVTPSNICCHFWRYPKWWILLVLLSLLIGQKRIKTDAFDPSLPSLVVPDVWHKNRFLCVIVAIFEGAFMLGVLG